MGLPSMEEFSWPVMTASIRGLSTLVTEVCAVMATVSWATKGDGLVRGKTLKELLSLWCRCLDFLKVVRLVFWSGDVTWCDSLQGKQVELSLARASRSLARTIALRAQKLDLWASLVVAMYDQLKKIPLANISIDHVKMKPKQITAPGQTVEVFSFLEGFHIAFIRNNG